MADLETQVGLVYELAQSDKVPNPDTYFLVTAVDDSDPTRRRHSANAFVSPQPSDNVTFDIDASFLHLFSGGEHEEYHIGKRIIVVTLPEALKALRNWIDTQPKYKGNEQALLNVFTNSWQQP